MTYPWQRRIRIGAAAKPSPVMRAQDEIAVMGLRMGWVSGGCASDRDGQCSGAAGRGDGGTADSACCPAWLEGAAKGLDSMVGRAGGGRQCLNSQIRAPHGRASQRRGAAAGRRALLNVHAPEPPGAALRGAEAKPELGE